jgi:hypothetical protein
MIHFHGMAQLMEDNEVDQIFGQKHTVKRKIYIFHRRAASPAGTALIYLYYRVLEGMLFG